MGDSRSGGSESHSGARWQINKHSIFAFSPFCPLLTATEGTAIGVTAVLATGMGITLLLAALGLCLGAMEVAVGPADSVILE